MAKFMLFLHETPAPAPTWTPEEMQGIIERYTAWSSGLMERKLMAEKLREEGGRHVRRSGSEVTVADGPYSETKEVIGGLYLIEAADYDEAVRIASTCPHLDFGWIEVREVDPV